MGLFHFLLYNYSFPESDLKVSFSAFSQYNPLNDNALS
ncbi:hypothetical protein M099_2213 [Phocaeicola vulgatus str. 3975 RP4]|uniref:Uncharacterized protein n=2 Tax=Phocaeicola vulgatus TaxID=821 RepID=A0A078REZ8_PHOVU|nr:hypothetical protein M097_0452 [Phocaeicola vulgatus str. 3775 SL(B) 10 (iv)]KDS37120.1 hypothetical protein M098_4138 [Phocaeicola vulgatus str. 3775 SR(B) 19]KDS53796.1 hypothetical protein M099_2213 [Phocaeicola vulgatus str. 3975 RP4]